MSIFTISDTHFGNENIIKYANRPFTSSSNQTEQLIQNWNSIVSPADTVIHCGDFIMGDPANIHSILPRLNGFIVLVRGNHDTSNKLSIYGSWPPGPDGRPKVTFTNIHYLSYNGLFFVFCHFPIIDPTYGKMITEDNSEVCWVHGHVHNKALFFNAETHSFNVSVEATLYHPVPLDTLFNLCRDDFIKKCVWRGR